MRHQAQVAIVDDENSMRQSVVRLLGSCGFEVETFATAVDFLETLAERTPDCLILDLTMPSMSGIDLLRTMAALPRTPPVIVLTAERDPNRIAECQRLGARICLPKPVEGAILIDSVREAIASA